MGGFSIWAEIVDLDSLKSGEFASFKERFPYLGVSREVWEHPRCPSLRTTQLYGGHPLQQNVPNKTC